MRSASPRVLITGIAGFVGGWLAAELRDRMPNCDIVGTKLEAEQSSDRRTIVLDVRDAASVDNAIAAVRPDVVVHLAAISTVSGASSDAGVAMDVNLLGTMRLADAVIRHVPAARFIYVSSSDIYGATFARWPVPLNEDAPLAPTNSYASSKAAADLLIGQMSASQGLLSVRVRPFNHTGPRQDARFVIPSFARQIARIEAGLQPPSIAVGNLEGFRELLDVRDVVRAYVDLIAADIGPFDGQAINLSSGRPVKVRSLLDQLISFAQVSVEVVVDPDRFRAETSRFIGGDATRARELLGWKPKIPLDDTLCSVLDAERRAVAQEA